MKKYWTFGSKQLILRGAVPLTIVYCAGVVISLFFDYRFSLFYFLGGCLNFSIIRFLAIPNAFSITKMDESTIQNKHLSIAWEEIENIEICAVRYRDRAWRLKDLDSVICMGKPKKSRFGAQSSKRSVFVPMSKKNLQKLKEYGYGKSKALDELLDKYAILYEK